LAPYRAVHFDHPTTSFRLAPRSARPLERQIYDALRERILDGRIASGERLPSTRELASRLDVARATVAAAFAQLAAEGFIEGRRGSGSFVCEGQLVLPASTPLAPRGAGVVVRRTRAAEQLTASAGAALRRDGLPRAFQVAVPALDRFPVATWTRLTSGVWKTASSRLLSYQDRRGLPELRDAIARYLAAERGVHCDAEQILVTSGSQQAIRLAAALLLDAGDAVWMEDPGYYNARSAFVDANAQVVPVAVDDEGLRVVDGLARAPRARLAYVTPTHQMPLGVRMSVRRRLALLAWAAESDALVIEDDFDGDLELRGRPTPTLFELDAGRRVLHVGSFSFVLYPGLRIGYVVVPPPLAELFGSARAQADLGAGGVDQLVLARFLAEGHLYRHVRRSRKIYAERAQALVEALSSLEGVEIDPPSTGIHATVWLPRGVDDVAVAAALEARGLSVRPLAVYRAARRTKHERGGLVLGYGCVDPREIRRAARLIGEVLRAMPR
jgi:GntR family transcriptional regulator/MocR family aminotransferase